MAILIVYQSAKMKTLSSVCLQFMLMTIVLMTTLSTAGGTLCNSVEGSVPNNQRYSWSLPVYSTGTSALISVKVAADLFLALFSTNSSSPPYNNKKYQIVFGSHANTKSFIANTAFSPPSYYAYNDVARPLNANSYVTLWISWGRGTIAAGTGPIVGQNTLLSYTDSSPTPINYILVGGYSTPGNIVITYCYHARWFDQTLPTDGPTIALSTESALDCGRACDADVRCQGYAVRRNVTPVCNTACNIFYSISGLQMDQQYVSYVVRNFTYLD